MCGTVAGANIREAESSSDWYNELKSRKTDILGLEHFFQTKLDDVTRSRSDRADAKELSLSF